MVEREEGNGEIISKKRVQRQKKWARRKGKKTHHWEEVWSSGRVWVTEKEQTDTQREERKKERKNDRENEEARLQSDDCGQRVTSDNGLN